MKIYFSPKYSNSYYGKSTNTLFFPKLLSNSDTFTRVNPLDIALSNLNNLVFDKKDVKKIENYFTRLPFENGMEAVKFAKLKNINIKFDKIDDKSVHAQWCKAGNSVIINDLYKNTSNSAEIFAISAALLHELSHAKDGDDESSIQEEIDCLAMNALAFNVFKKQNPNLFLGQQSALLDDGVKIYTDLFFGNNENALITRIKSKYGTLKLASPNHPAGILAYKIMTSNFK